MSRADAGAELSNWVIEQLVPGGDAMARLSDGRIAFATGALPGDVIRPRAVEARKGHLRATRWEIAEPSPHRVVPSCPVAEQCGGCDWMMLERGEQLVQKGRLLRSALERTSGIRELPREIPMTAAGGDVRYRSRVRFQVDAAGRIGFFARGTHEIVAVASCLVCRPEIDRALVALRRLPDDMLAAFSGIEVRIADEAPRTAIRLSPRVRNAVAPMARAALAKLPEGWSVTIEGDEGHHDEREQRFPLPEGVVLYASPGAFTQVNWAVNEALVGALVAGARARGVRSFCDAYAGAGNFSLPLLASGMRGSSIEKDARAVASSRRAAEAQGLDATGFVVGDAPARLADLAREGAVFDLVLLDPPRAGARDAIGAVVALRPEHVALCSCDPVTLARDLGTLAARGYELREVRGFDMFPQTHHLETLAWMTLASPASPTQRRP